MSTTMVKTNRNPGCLIQLLWFAFVGIWLGQIWAVVAWILTVSVIGLPFGIAMLNMLPKVIALREPESVVRISDRNGQLNRERVENRQLPFILRALYFVLIGWWFSALWIEAAFAISLTVIGLPVGFWMFDLVPGVLTLKR